MVKGLVLVHPKDRRTLVYVREVGAKPRYWFQNSLSAIHQAYELPICTAFHTGMARQVLL